MSIGYEILDGRDDVGSGADVRWRGAMPVSSAESFATIQMKSRQVCRARLRPARISSAGRSLVRVITETNGISSRPPPFRNRDLLRLCRAFVKQRTRFEHDSTTSHCKEIRKPGMERHVNVGFYA